MLSTAIAVLGISCSGGTAPENHGLEQRRALSPGVIFEMLRDNPDLIVLDVRPFSDYVSSTGHLERALSVPADRMEELWPALRLGAEETILVYGDEHGSHQAEAMRFLLASGQRYVVQIEGGVQAWREGGFEVVVEDAPLSPVRID
jgi:rhodanese-related sulfurtransferase